MRVDFLGNYVIYTTAIDGDAFQSIHNRSGMSDQEAARAFHREHAREIEVLKKQRDENKSTTLDSGVLRFS
jgi:hypothetical protein